MYQRSRLHGLPRPVILFMLGDSVQLATQLGSTTAYATCMFYGKLCVSEFKSYTTRSTRSTLKLHSADTTA